ncbi:MAG: sulfatase-like hydrolase/transferase [Chitinophagaceae bacterium]|nr:sulfatase-like hydrolase/transferase [Chitinophagaceae bacterium]
MMNKLFPFFFLLGLYTQPGFAQKKPNIILIMADDMGYSDLGCFGNPVIQTPFLDGLAHKGFLSSNFVVSSPSCTPSRASLLTGRYASRYDLPDPIPPGAKRGLPDIEITIAEMLKPAGYHTAMVGKWHLGDLHPYNRPNGQGFDFYYGMLYSQDYRHPYVKTDTTIKIFRNETPEIYKPEDSMLTRLYTREAVRVIREQKAGQPLFLYIAYNMPHLPVYFAAQSAALNDKPGGPLGKVVAEIDESVNTIWQAIEKKGMADNTVLIFLSDNGPWSDYPPRMEGDGVTRKFHAGAAGIFRGSKAMSYEGGARVPFIVYWKNKIDKGVHSSFPISNVDILPTVAKWANAPLPAGRNIDGQDISPLLESRVKEADFIHKPVFIVNHGKPEAVKAGKWKYRESPDWRRQSNNELVPAIKELFNLDEDPSERVNLIDVYPEKTKEMKRIFDGFSAYSFGD